MRTCFAALVFFCLLVGAVHAMPAQQIRLTPDDIFAKSAQGAGAGTSGVTGIQTTVLQGDPSKPGIYTIRLSIPASTKIAAHRHRDNRAAIVMSGTWYFGYGLRNDVALAKPLAPGSFYTEPAGVAHFAGTRAEPVVVIITGYGPSDTVYINAADDPRTK